MTSKDEKLSKIIVGDRLKDIRQRKGMSMSDVAKHSNITPGNISKIEHGIHTPKLATLHSLAKCFDMTDEDLFDQLGIPYSHNHNESDYRQVRVISSRIKNPEWSLQHPAKFRTELPRETPRHCFIIKCCDDMDNNLRRGMLVLVDEDYTYQSGHYYAIELHDRLLLGRVYKRPDFKEGVLINKSGVYFSTWYKGQFKILGEAIRFSDHI